MARLRPATTEKQESVTPTLFEKPEDQPTEEAFGAKDEPGAEPELKVEAKPEPKVEPKPELEAPKVEEPKPDEAALALQRQIEALRQSEHLLRQQNREYEQRIVQVQRESEQKDEQTIQSGLDGAQAAKEKALSDLRNAETDGDIAAKAEAYDRLTKANILLDRWETAKESVEERKKAPPAQPQQPQFAPGSDAEIDSWDVPPRPKAWAKEHRDWVTEPSKRAKLQHITVYLAQVHGITPAHDDYIPRIEAEIGIRKPEPPAPAPQEPERRVMVSAPPSRETPSAASGIRQSNKAITLTADQKEAAKMSGVTETEYARQLMKINEQKANGQFAGDTR